jgi:hypothetical protein
MTTLQKLCTTCLITKDTDNFGEYKDKKGTIKTRAECKHCRVIRESQRNLNKKDVRKDYCKAWRDNNKEHIKMYENERCKLKRCTDELFRFKINMTSYLRKLVTGERKHVKYLGCSRDELQTWFEYIMPSNLSWHKPEEWQIDHVIPISFFDLNDVKQLSIAYHWSNIRPTTENENRAKNSFILDDVIKKHTYQVIDFIKIRNYQVSMETCLWQTVEVWYGNKSQDERNLSDFLKWKIRSQ